MSHLGCSFEDGRDLFPLSDLERLFKVERLNKAPATFDYQKLEWYNGQYIRMKSDAELRDLVMPYLEQAGLVGAEPTEAAMRALVLGAMPLVKERLRFLSDAPIMMRYLFEEPPLPAPEEFIPKKLDRARTAELLAAAGALLPVLRPIRPRGHGGQVSGRGRAPGRQVRRPDDAPSRRGHRLAREPAPLRVDPAHRDSRRPRSGSRGLESAKSSSAERAQRAPRETSALDA